ncbi:MAG: O-antigen ligase family protein [Chloroflexota bacterium]
MSTTMPTTEDALGGPSLQSTKVAGEVRNKQLIKPATFDATSAGLLALLVLAVSADRLGLGAGSLNLRTELMAGGLAALILLLRDWRACLRGWGLVDACLGGWLIVNLVSSLLFSPEIRESLKYVAILAGLLTIYLAARLLITSEVALAWATTLFIVLGAAAALAGLLCALMYNIIGPNFGVLLERFYRDGVFVVTPKIQGVLWEPNIYGSFSLAVAVLAGSLALRRPTPAAEPFGNKESNLSRLAHGGLRSSPILSVAIALGMSGVILSMTRTVWVIGPVLILLLAATAWKIKLASPRTIAMALLLPAMLGSLIGLGVGASLPAPQWKMGEPWDLTAAQVDDMVRARLFTNIAPAPQSDLQLSATPIATEQGSAPADRVGELLNPGGAPSLSSRWRIYTDALNGWLRRPILGWGAGTFPYVYPPPPEGGTWIANAELHTLFDTGIVGLLLLAAAAFIAGRRALNTLRLPPARWELNNYLTFGILFASLGLLAAFQITDGTWLGFTWLLLAMLVATGQKTGQPQSKGKPGSISLQPPDTIIPAAKQP